MSRIKKIIRVGTLWKFKPEGVSVDELTDEFMTSKPDLRITFERSNVADGNAMLAMWGKRKVGYVNADDQKWLLPVMEGKGRRCVLSYDRMVLRTDGQCPILKYSVMVDTDSVTDAEVPEDDWRGFHYSFAQLDTTEEMDALQFALGELDELQRGAVVYGMSRADCVDMICENCRFDLSRETSRRIDDCCFALEMAGDEESVALLDRLEEASTGRRGVSGEAAWESWFQNLLKSKRAERLLMLYKNECRRNRNVRRVNDEMMQNDLDAIEDELLLLPFNLHMYIDNPSRLMHLAYYKQMPEEIQLELLSALVLRQLLINHLRPKVKEAEMAETEEMKTEVVETETVEAEVAETEPVEELPAGLAECFFGIRKNALDFYYKIKDGKKGTYITKLVSNLVNRHIISEESCHRVLYNILKRNGLYKHTEANWNQQVNSRY